MYDTWPMPVLVALFVLLEPVLLLPALIRPANHHCTPYCRSPVNVTSSTLASICTCSGETSRRRIAARIESYSPGVDMIRSWLFSSIGVMRMPLSLPPAAAGAPVPVVDAFGCAGVLAWR